MNFAKNKQDIKAAQYGFADIITDEPYIHVDFRDNAFVARYKKAKKTAIRLAMSGRLVQLPITHNHTGFGRYEHSFDFDAPLWWHCEPIKLPNITMENGYMIVPFYHSIYGYNSTSSYSEVSVFYCGSERFCKTMAYECLHSPLLRKCYIRNLVSREDRFVSQQAVVDVMLWQMACHLRSKKLREEFVGEIHSYQYDFVRREARRIRPDFQGCQFARWKKQISAGAFAAVKNELRNLAKYKFSSKVVDTSQEYSRQQLRALGFVA